MSPQERVAFNAMQEALSQFLSIYPEKVRAHPDVRIACEAARAALALAEAN